MLCLEASRQTTSLSVSLDLIIFGQWAFQQPAFLDLSDFSNESLVPSLKDLVEDDPIRLPVLLVVSRVSKSCGLKYTYKHEGTWMSVQGHVPIDCLEGPIRLHSSGVSEVTKC